MDNYVCQHCNNYLNVDEELILIGENNYNERGLIILNTKLGRYDSRFNRLFKVQFGELLDFFCPCCSQSLDYEENIQFVRLVKENVNGEDSSVIFSKIKGEYCTLVKEDEHTETYGEHAMRYTDPEWFLKEHVHM